MAHPYASQAKASQKRRLSKLGAKAGKSFGSSSMYKKTSYPGKNAGSSTPMTISGGSSRKRADQPAKYADGGAVRPKAKKPHSTTNIIIANGGRRGNRGNRPQQPVVVPRPVPVPVPVGGAPGGAPPPRPVIVGGGGGPPMAGPMGPPPGAMPAGPPPGMMRPPGMAGGGLAGPSYHNWGEGYKEGGVVKKASGGSIEKKAVGGRMIRGGNRPAQFKPGAVPGQPVVPLQGRRPGGPPSPMGGLGMKKGGKAKKYQDGGDVDDSEPEPAASSTSVAGDKGGGFDMKKTLAGMKDLGKAIDPVGSAAMGVNQARSAESLAEKTMMGNDASVRKLGGIGKPQGGGFKPGALPYASKTFAKGGKVHDDEAQDRKLIKSMLAKEEKAEKKADGGFVPTNEKSKDSALIGSTYRNQGTGFNRGGVVKKAGSHSGLGRLQKIPAAKAVPAKTEL